VRLAVVCPRFPYPLEKGDKLRIYHQLRLLSEHHEICLIAIAEQQVADRYRTVIEDITTECHIITIPKSARTVSAAMALLTGGSLQSAHYYSRKAHSQVRQILAEFAPDHIYCQLIRVAAYVQDSPLPKTLDYMDAFGVGMERRATVTNGLQKLLYKIEAKRCKQHEVAVYQKFDHHTIISEQDRLCIGSGELPITVNPNGIDTTYFSPIDKFEDHDIGFVGNMGYPPNVDAAEYLVNKLGLGDKYKLLIAGARPSKRVKLLASDNVTITGWVDDVRQEYARCHIFVAPLWSGTGQQNKILEAMAMGIPCVTTSAVNNAIRASDGNEILIADSEDQFAKAIGRLMTDAVLHKKIRENGIRLVKDKFSWRHNVDTLQGIFNKGNK